MSDQDPSKQSHTDGGGTHSGGGPPQVFTGTPGPVANQPLLALHGSVLSDLNSDELHALKVVQLEFARDVSLRAADAYQQTLSVLQRKPADTAR